MSSLKRANPDSSVEIPAEKQAKRKGASETQKYIVDSFKEVHNCTLCEHKFDPEVASLVSLPVTYPCGHQTCIECIPKSFLNFGNTEVGEIKYVDQPGVIGGKPCFPVFQCAFCRQSWDYDFFTSNLKLRPDIHALAALLLPRCIVKPFIQTKTFECPKCIDSFSSLQDVMQHYLKRCDYRLKCNACGLEYSIQNLTLNGIQDGYQTHLETECINLRCPGFCNFRSDMKAGRSISYPSLVSHINIHNNLNQIQPLLKDIETIFKELRPAEYGFVTQSEVKQFMDTAHHIISNFGYHDEDPEQLAPNDARRLEDPVRPQVAIPASRPNALRSNVIAHVDDDEDDDPDFDPSS